MTDGLLKTSDGQLLPKLQSNKTDCEGVVTDISLEFMAGDVRARENPGLLSLHTIFMREHNRIAKLVGAYVPTWSDEDIYQFTRRHVHCRVRP